MSGSTPAFTTWAVTARNHSGRTTASVVVRLCVSDERGVPWLSQRLMM